MLDNSNINSDEINNFSDSQKEEIIDYNQDEEEDQSCISYSLEIEKSQNTLLSDTKNKQISDIQDHYQSLESNNSSLTRKLQDTGRLQNEQEIMEVVLKTKSNNNQQQQKNIEVVEQPVDIKIDEPQNFKSYQQLFSEFEIKVDNNQQKNQHDVSKSFENLESVFKVNSQNMTLEEKEFMNYVHQQKMVSAFEIENTKNQIDSQQTNLQKESHNTASFQYQDNQTSLKQFDKIDQNKYNNIKGNPNTKKSYNLDSISELLKKKIELEDVKKNFQEFQKYGLDDEEQNQFRKTINELDEELIFVEEKIKTLQNIENQNPICNNDININNKLQDQDIDNNLPEVFLNFDKFKQDSMDHLKDLQIPKQKPQEILIQPLKNSRRITFSATPQEENLLKSEHNQQFNLIPLNTGVDLLSSERVDTERTLQNEYQTENNKPKIKRLKKRRDFKKNKKNKSQKKLKTNHKNFDEYYNNVDTNLEQQSNKKLKFKKLKQKSVPTKPLFSSNYLSKLSSQKNKNALNELTKNFSSSLKQKNRKNFSIKNIVKKKKQSSINKKLFPIVKTNIKSHVSSRDQSKKIFSRKPKKKSSQNKKLLPLQTSQKKIQRKKYGSKQKNTKKNQSLSKNNVKYQIPKFDNFKFKTQTVFKKTPGKYSLENKTKFSKFNYQTQKPIQNNQQINRIKKKLHLWEKEVNEINSLIKNFENFKLQFNYHFLSLFTISFTFSSVTDLPVLNFE